MILTSKTRKPRECEYGEREENGLKTLTDGLYVNIEHWFMSSEKQRFQSCQVKLWLFMLIITRYNKHREETLQVPRKYIKVDTFGHT